MASLEGFASLLPNKEMLEEEVWRQVLGIRRSSKGGEWLSFLVRQGILEKGLRMKGGIGLTFMEPPWWVRGLIFIIPLNRLSKPLKSLSNSSFYR